MFKLFFKVISYKSRKYFCENPIVKFGFYSYNNIPVLNRSNFQTGKSANVLFINVGANGFYGLVQRCIYHQINKSYVY